MSLSQISPTNKFFLILFYFSFVKLTKKFLIRKKAKNKSINCCCCKHHLHSIANFVLFAMFHTSVLAFNRIHCVSAAVSLCYISRSWERDVNFLHSQSLHLNRDAVHIRKLILAFIHPSGLCENLPKTMKTLSSLCNIGCCRSLPKLC